MTATARCPGRRLVDRHFAGRAATEEEAELRAHLLVCAGCAGHYERHLLYAELTDTGASPAARIAAGLGLGHRASRSSVRVSSLSLAFAACAAAAALVLVTLRDRPAAEFAARGGAASAQAPGLEIFKVRPDAAPIPAAGSISPSDELAFTYRNPAGFRQLLVFALDEGGRVYWFHPAWTDPAQDPVAVPIVASAGPRELPEAIRHDLRGPTVRVVGVFTNDPLSVRTVERHVREGKLDRLPGVRVEARLEVRP